MTPTQSFRVHALSTEALELVRASRVDASGNPVVALTAAGDGEPLRCCLRNARRGESILLFGYEPPIAAGSPYREIGAVFAHADPCAGPADGEAYPEAWRGKPQVVRSYDRRGWIRAAVVHDGSHPERDIARLFEDPRAVQVHSRNVAYGCFMFQVTRGSSVRKNKRRNRSRAV